MTTSTPCPPTERLRELLAAPPGSEPPELIAHLDVCTSCRLALDHLAGASPALLSAAGSLASDRFTTELPLRRLLDDLASDSGLTVLSRPAAHPTWVRSFLQPSDTPGTLGRLGEYEVFEILGQGSMGLVLKAFEPALKRWVAVKVLTPAQAGDEIARRRFAREAQAAAAVHHPHVITIHAVSEADGLPFFVMEYVAGGSLQDYLDQHGSPGWQAAARLGEEIAEGLAAAHARGLIHRDVKPSNLLLQPAATGAGPGSVKIGDFGLARVADDVRLTHSGLVAGTPMYMAPEQAHGEPLDHRTDLFSLGSVLYALCTGRPPFPAPNPMAVLRQVCDATPRPIRELNRDVPTWLAAAVERLHAKRPADRCTSAAEVAGWLRHNRQHPEDPRPLPPHRGRRSGRRVLIVGCLALALAGGLVLSEALHWTDWTGWFGHDAPAGPVRSRATLRGHEGPVWSVAFAPDGKTLATGSDDRTLRFWDAATGRQQAVVPGHSSTVLAVAYAHSGEFLVSGGSDGILRLWDPATRKVLGDLPRRNGSVRRILIAPDDRTVAVRSAAQGVELWNLETRTLRRTLPGRNGTILTLAYSPGGELLATGDSRGGITLWDPATGAERAEFQGDPLGLRVLAFTPDGRTLVSAGSGDRDVKLWKIATRERVGDIEGFESGVTNVTVSPDGRLLATSGREGVVRLWSLPSGRALASLRAHGGNVWGVAFSPDGRTLATVGEDRLGKLWDLDGLPGATP